MKQSLVVHNIDKWLFKQLISSLRNNLISHSLTDYTANESFHCHTNGYIFHLWNNRVLCLLVNWTVILKFTLNLISFHRQRKYQFSVFKMDPADCCQNWEHLLKLGLWDRAWGAGRLFKWFDKMYINLLECNLFMLIWGKTTKVKALLIF